MLSCCGFIFSHTDTGNVTNQRAIRPASNVICLFRGIENVKHNFTMKFEVLTAMKMETVWSSRSLVSTYKSTQSYKPKDQYWHRLTDSRVI